MSILENMDAKIDALAAHVKDGLGLIAAMAKTMEDWKAKPEWESMATAMKTRRKTRRILVRAVNAGQIRHQRLPKAQGGHEPYLMNREDLDRLYPVVKH